MQHIRPGIYPYANPVPTSVSGIRVQATDFRVEEILGFEPDGSGQHILLRIKKCERNTNDVAAWLSKHCHVHPREIGYCGMKDRNAVSTQWFSVCTNEEPTLEAAEADGFSVLDRARHGRKLKRGFHQGNRFAITLRDVALDAQALSERFELISKNGVPNYFGPQRFGRSGENVLNGLAMMKGQFKPRRPHVKGILLSALRSYLFNEVLARRVEAATWNLPIDGDVMQFEGGSSYFHAEVSDANLLARSQRFEINPTGPLPGPGDAQTTANAAAIEAEVLDANPEIAEALLTSGPDADRRSLRLVPGSPSLRINADKSVTVAFDLGRGSFATSLLRELTLDRDLAPPWQPDSAVDD